MHRLLLSAAGAVVLAGALVAVFVVGLSSSNPDPACTMDGAGVGFCTFTNHDAYPWKACGSAKVGRKTTTEAVVSPVFCSGLLWPKSSVTVSFTAPGTAAICAGGPTWKDVCVFAFEPVK